MAKKPTSFMNWLGRQLGHMKGAAKTPVPAQPKVVYRKESVQQAPHPERPNEILRRTTIDEVVIPPATTTTKRNEN